MFAQREYDARTVPRAMMLCHEMVQLSGQHVWSIGDRDLRVSMLPKKRGYRGHNKKGTQWQRYQTSRRTKGCTRPRNVVRTLCAVGASPDSRGTTSTGDRQLCVGPTVRSSEARRQSDHQPGATTVLATDTRATMATGSADFLAERCRAT